MTGLSFLDVALHDSRVSRHGHVSAILSIICLVCKSWQRRGPDIIIKWQNCSYLIIQVQESMTHATPFTVYTAPSASYRQTVAHPTALVMTNECVTSWAEVTSWHCLASSVVPMASPTRANVIWAWPAVNHNDRLASRCMDLVGVRYHFGYQIRTQS